MHINKSEFKTVAFIHFLIVKIFSIRLNIRSRSRQQVARSQDHERILCPS